MSSDGQRKIGWPIVKRENNIKELLMKRENTTQEVGTLERDRNNYKKWIDYPTA